MSTDTPSPSGHSASWQAIFKRWEIENHAFDREPFRLSARQINEACQDFTRPSEKEARILCKQDTRESRPSLFQRHGLFILPVRNGQYVLVKGEGYLDIPTIDTPVQEYSSDFPFLLETSRVGDSEMQHLDRAFALSLIRHFTEDPSLVMTIRGRKYTPKFEFVTGEFLLEAEGVQTEVDAGYEGENQVVLVEAKSPGADNTIIRQLYYPFRQWSKHTQKPVSTLFFQYTENCEFHLWQFAFKDVADYNSVHLVKSGRFRIAQHP